MFFASFSLSLSFFFACSSWPSLRPFTRLDYDGGRGQVLNRIPFAVMRARREHFRKEAVQPTMCFVHHRATMQFQCRSGRNCRNYSPCLNVLFYATETSSMPSEHFVGRNGTESLLLRKILATQVSWVHGSGTRGYKSINFVVMSRDKINSLFSKYLFEIISRSWFITIFHHGARSL